MALPRNREDENQIDFVGHTDDPVDILEHLEVEDLRQRWPKMLVDLLDVMEATLKRHQVNTPDEVAILVIQELALYAGGRSIYLPSNKNLTDAIRDRQMYREFTGNNHESLAVKYRCTVRRVYQILAEQTRLHRNKIQPDLFSKQDQ